MLQQEYPVGLTDFLIKHSVKDDKAKVKTHTRIPDNRKDSTVVAPNTIPIYGGSYSIPENELPQFYELYYEAVFVKRKMEYLTECQLTNGKGPMAIDLDFKYNATVVTRPHTAEDVSNIISLYLDELKQYFVFDEDVPFDVFVFEKNNVNRLADGSMTKDGIHLLFGLQVNHTVQLMIRETIITKMAEVLDLPLINDFENVLDETISRGSTNWQLFGSRKPHHDAYELTQHWIALIDPSDNEFSLDEQEVRNFNMRVNFKKLSVQYTGIPAFPMNPLMVEKYTERTQLNSKKTTRPSGGKAKINRIVRNDGDDDEADSTVNLSEITTVELLVKAVNGMLSVLVPSEYEINELHQYTQILPAKYYEPGSHLLSRQVAFALKNKDSRLFLSWMLLRSKASDFDISEIGGKYDEWVRMKYRKDGITERSIMYWAKQDAFDEYERVKAETVDHHIESTLVNGQTEFDKARVLQKMYADKYVCTSLSSKTWYSFKAHRWVPDKGMTLRLAISTSMHEVYDKKRSRAEDEFTNIDPTVDHEQSLAVGKKIKALSDIMIGLKKTNEKDHIMREAMELFYNKEFLAKVDSKTMLLGFKNGVVDFNTKTFRPGTPEDYITMSTGINYVEFDENDPEMVATSLEVLDLMKKLFPIESVNRYMWDHLASCLIGTSLNQTFNIYFGSGSNGKSILTDLMSRALGDYKGTVPINLITDKRTAIGGTSSEIVQLKGVRYAVMQEPSKDTKINEGIMKELTGGDPIQGRALYMESETFTPQFNLVVCTNSEFKIDSNDDGTWRRIRQVKFKSKFVDDSEPLPSDPIEREFVFPKDKNLKEKLPKLAQVFMSMLVKRAFVTNGKVVDCAIVLKASTDYRDAQDSISMFLKESFIDTGNRADTVSFAMMRGLYKKFTANYMASVPKMEIAKHYRQDRYKNRVWLSEPSGSKMEGLKLIPIAENFVGNSAAGALMDQDIASEVNLLSGEEI
jgi:P4 family phage/plasmid primase-like protien